MTVTNDLLARKGQNRASFDAGSALSPVRKVAAEAAAEDATRSLVISEWLLGLEEIILIAHPDSGMDTLTDGGEEEISAAAGFRAGFALEGFEKAEDDVHNAAPRTAGLSRSAW